jgi:hypothetical protein
VSRSADAWRTSAVEQAEARLEKVAAQADAAIAKAHALRIAPTPPLSEQDLRWIEEAARAADASHEMRELQQRIEAGEFSWRDVVDGRQMHDPGVRAALGAGLETMASAYRQFDEGYQLDEVLAAHQPRNGPSGQRMLDDDDGEWFVESIYDGRSR